MKKTGWLIAVAAIILLFFQCQKEVNFTGGPDTGSSVNPEPIKASLQGNITDENQQPAAGVVVTAGTSTTVTDASGYFRFTNATLDKNTTLVTASKDGYFKGYRVFAATSGCNQVAIELTKKYTAETVAAVIGGSVTVSGVASVSLPANGIVTASSGSVYSGDVKVNASYINAEGSNIKKTIPGALVANNKEGKRVTLQSYGTMAVELASAGGEKLQIKSGNTATLTMPIAASYIALAPATVPLWYLDETTGIWQEEGIATRQGNNYIGEVKHFSFWDAGSAQSGVNLSLTLQAPSGAPLIYSQVRVSALSTTDSGGSYLASHYAFTDSLGQVSELVPANEELTLEVLGECGLTAYSQMIPPLTQDKNLGIIQVTANTVSSLLTVTGTLQDCNSAAVTNGYAIIDFNGTRRYVSVNSSGTFTTDYVTCPGFNTTVYITGVDAAQQVQSTQATVTASKPLTDAGTIVACGTVVDDQYINYTIDGATTYSITTSQGDSLYSFINNGSQVNISGYSSVSKLLKFYAQGVTTTGSFDIGGLYVNNGSDTLNIDAGSKVTFTRVPSDTGNIYQGHFYNLSYWDSIPTVRHTISATFKIEKN